MKGLRNFWRVKNGRYGVLFCLVLMLLSVLAGGGVLMAEGVVAPVDPVDPKVNDNASPDGAGAGQDLSGTVASGTQARRGDLVEDEWDTEVAHFHEKKFPLDTMIRLRAKKRPATGYEIGHYRDGSTVIDCKTTAEIGDGESTTVSLTSANVSGKLTMFPAFEVIHVQGVAGYDESTENNEDGTLLLFVKSNDGNTAVCEALNGLYVGDGMPTKVPVIPAGTTLSAIGNACYESQLVVAPSNFQPRPIVTYLQKHIFNYVLTSHFKELIKKTPHAEKDIREAALYDFRRKRERSALIGQQRRILVNVPNMGEQYVYFSRGVLRQLINKFGVDKWDFSTMIALHKMQFTDFSENSEADFFCGKNMLEKIQNIDFTKHKDVTYTGETIAGIEITAFKSIFGKFNIIHEPQLDDLGLADYGFICDIKNAVRYVKEEGKEDTKSMDDGSENAQDAERTRHIEIDAICLKGYNSMLVGPSAGIDSLSYTKSATNIMMVASVPSTPTEGMKIYLTVDDAELGLNADSVYEYKNGKWSSPSA